MDWKIFLQTIIYLLVGTGILTYIIKRYISFIFDKDLDKFRSQLNLEVESYKATLQLENEKNRIKFLKLHEKRGIVIEEFYQKLISMESSMRSFITPMQWVGEKSKDEKKKMASVDYSKFIDYYTKNKIFFQKPICKIIDEIDQEVKKAFTDFTLYPSYPTEKAPPSIFNARDQKKRIELWQKAWDNISQKIPVLKEQLEDEFRIILGVDEKTI